MKYITEKDLYMYVMHPNELSEGKSNYIKSNLNQFKDQIALLKKLKKESNSEISNDIINDILAKIKGQSK